MLLVVVNVDTVRSRGMCCAGLGARLFMPPVLVPLVAVPEEEGDSCPAPAPAGMEGLGVPSR